MKKRETKKTGKENVPPLTKKGMSFALGHPRAYAPQIEMA